MALILISISCADIESVQKSNGKEESAAGGNSSNGEFDKEKTPDKNRNSPANINQNPAKSEAEDFDKNSPEQLVEKLYKKHDSENSPFFQDRNRGLVDEFFTKRLADMIWKDAVESKGEVGALDFDPLYNAQDTEISDFNIGKSEVGKSEIEGETVTVPVTFTNFGEKQTIKYLLTKENNVWKIGNIGYKDFTLISVFLKNSK